MAAADTPAGLPRATFMDAVPLGMLLVDARGRLVEVNRAACALLGRTRSELLALELPRLPDARDLPVLPGDLTAPLVPEGSGHGIRATAGPLPEGGWVVTLADLRDQDDVLARQAELFRKTFHACPMGISIVTLSSGVFMEVNEALLQLRGLRRDQVIGHTSAELDTWADPAERDHYLEALNTRGYIRNFEAHLKVASGGYGHFLLSSETVDVLGQKCSFNFLVDITGRKRAEDDLRLSEERLGTIFMESPVALSVSEYLSGLFVDVNRAFLKLVGAASPDEVLGRRAVDLGFISYEDRARLVEVVMAQGGAERFPTLLRRLDGSAFEAELSLSTYVMGGRRFLLAGILDVTERAQSLREREHLQGQLLQSQKMESIGRLAGGVAHDFNNMLGVILMNTDLLLDRVGPDPLLEGPVRQIRVAADKSAELTRQLLAFARKQTVAPQVLDVNASIEGTLKMLRRVIGEDIEILWRPGEGLWKTSMDPAQLDQILMNLVVNARDAIPGEGRITLETRNVVIDQDYAAMHIEAGPGAYVALSVTDSGCGMDRETQARIFEPFFTTKELGKGTGLGLAMVYGAVRQNNGFINVYSEPGQGSVFRVYLPRHSDGEAELGAPPAEEDAGRCTETVLMVEDNEALLESMRTILELRGYQVLAAPRPEEAVRLAHACPERIHLLLTDVVMPGLGVKDLVRQVQEAHPGLKCLYMSGYPADIIARQGILEQGVPFLHKPFSLRELLARMRSALEGA